jgi:hypothetical protein
MLQKFSNKFRESILRARTAKRGKLLVGFLIVAGFFVALYGSQLIIFVVYFIAKQFGFNIEIYNQNIISAILALILYIFTALIYGYMLNKFVFKLSRTDIGITGLPSWKDIGLAVVGFLVYSVLSAGLMALATYIIPGFDVNQDQNVGFSNLGNNFEYIFAFTTLVVIAPIAEELLFRGYLLGSLLRNFKPLLSVIIVSLIFGLVHGSWNVGIDTFALSIVLSIIRINSGTIWSGMLIHMTKNTIAFYLLFINPSFLSTLGG